MAKWNRVTLLGACEDMLRRDDVRLIVGPVKEPLTARYVADVDASGRLSNIEIRVDPAQGGLIESVLHELLHVVLDSILGARFNSPLEECMVKALERDLFLKAIKHGGLRRWRRLIESKI